MFSKFKFIKNSSGLTIVELVVSMAVLVLLMVTVVIIVNPTMFQSRARDEKRLGDLSILDRAINEYMLDNASYPDTVDTTRYSTSLPLNNVGPFENPFDGWIDVNMSLYLVRLPTDPINDVTYRYTYRHTQYGYELNAVLEEQVDYMSTDGGNNNSLYELGNDLTIL